jgi:hypothetical protein
MKAKIIVNYQTEEQLGNSSIHIIRKNLQGNDSMSQAFLDLD